MLEHANLILVSYVDLGNYIGCEGVAMIRTSPPGKRGVYAIYRGPIVEAQLVPIGQEKGYVLCDPTDGKPSQIISPSDRIWVKRRV